MIRIDGITKKYKNITAVSDISLNIRQKECVAILGHSGCGKTTLLRMIAGLEIPDKGEIYIGSRLANNPRIILPPYKRSVGMVFQDLALWPHMTVYENIAFGLENIFKDARKKKNEINLILKDVHLEKMSNSHPAQLSGGEQQRVALARALARKPDILLMDEPLAHLDYNLKDKMIGLVKNLHASYSMTLIYVTHDENTAKRIADKIFVMSEGKIQQGETNKRGIS